PGRSGGRQSPGADAPGGRREIRWPPHRRRVRIEGSPFVAFLSAGLCLMSAVHDEFASVLLARKVVSPEQLVEAFWLAVKWGCPLDEALLRLGYVSVWQIAEARAFWHGIQYIDLTEMTIPPAILELMPE